METPVLRGLLTRSEVANILRVHPSTVSRFVQARELPTVRIGKRPMFREQDVRQFIENRISS